MLPMMHTPMYRGKKALLPQTIMLQLKKEPEPLAV